MREGLPQRTTRCDACIDHGPSKPASHLSNSTATHHGAEKLYHLLRAALYGTLGGRLILGFGNFLVVVARPTPPLPMRAPGANHATIFTAIEEPIALYIVYASMLSTLTSLPYALSETVSSRPE